MAISQNIHILLVDENRTDLVTVKDLLSKTGFKNIKYAFNGPDGIKHITESDSDGKPVQLILCNYDMGEMNGVEFFKNVSELSVATKPKFLLLSGNSEQQHILSAVKAGVRNILLKPFSKQSLITELAKMLK